MICCDVLCKWNVEIKCVERERETETLKSHLSQQGLDGSKTPIVVHLLAEQLLLGEIRGSDWISMELL